VAVGGLLALWNCGATSGGEPAAKPDIDNATWTLSFEQFFPAKRGKDSPMKIYVVRRGGKWLHAVGSSPTWNTCTHAADVSNLTFADGALRGKLNVTLYGDPWVPADQKPVACALEINAKLDLQEPQKEGALDGTYQGTFGGAKAAGKLTGRVWVPKMTALDACQISFAMTDALAGGGNSWDRRLYIGFNHFDGQIDDAQFGPTDMKGNPTVLQPLDASKLRVTEHALSGEFGFDYEILAAIGDNSAKYHVQIDAKRVDDLIGGTFKVTATDAKKKQIVKEGGLKGWVKPATKTPSSIWAREKDTRPWFVPVKGFVPVKPGEHPRLFFRKSDLPELKRRAATPEGKAIIEQLRRSLGGGEALPESLSAASKAYDATKQKLPEGAYTMSHAAGFGMLYQLTGDKKYADLGRKCMELAFAGQRDRDDRYAWSAPGGELRAGPTLACYAMGYDLCYDGWDPAFRKKVALAIQNYSDVKAGEWNKAEGITLRQMAMTPKQMPASNHYGAVVGGAGIAVLAILGDPGTDDTFLKSYLAKVEDNMILTVSRGFGDHGYFSENAGPSHVAANSSFVPLLQAMKVAAGKDYISPRPNGQWLTMRWAMELLPDKNGRPVYPCRKPSSYGSENFLGDGAGGGVSHGGWFSQGFGAVLDEQKPALLWVYNHFVAEADRGAFTARNYPHRAVLALVNWPIGVKEKNPADVIPRAIVDKIHGYYVFRNRWQDDKDILVATLLSSGPLGHMSNLPGDVMVWGLGERTRFGRFGQKSQTTYYASAKDGSGIVAATDGNCLAVDFSKASGADALLVMTGPGAEGGKTVAAGGTTFHVLTLQAGEPPEIKVQGDKIVIGKQQIGLADGRIVLATLPGK
jgi:hypothetical protein